MVDNIKDLASRLNRVNRNVTGFIIINIPVILPYEDIGDLDIKEFKFTDSEGQAQITPTLRVGINPDNIQFACQDDEMAEQFKQVLTECKKGYEKRKLKVVKPSKDNVIRFDWGKHDR